MPPLSLRIMMMANKVEDGDGDEEESSSLHLRHRHHHHHHHNHHHHHDHHDHHHHPHHHNHNLFCFRIPIIAYLHLILLLLSSSSQSSSAPLLLFLLQFHIGHAVDNGNIPLHHHSNFHHNNPTNNNNNNHNGPRPPRIKEHPSSAVVKKHEPVTLSCKADGDPEPVIEWYRDNELVRKSPNHIYLNSGDLFILKVMNHKKEKDTGVYYCLARNVHGKARSHNATIEIASIRDEFRVLPKNVQAAVGDQAVLECSPPRGYPEPRVQWRKVDNNNNNIVTLGGRYRLSGGTNLHITDVQPEDAGRYQCIAQNMAGSRESPPANLIVRVKPYFIIKPEDVTAQTNKMAEIQCKVGGDPVPKVTWRREGGQTLPQRATITEDKSLRIYNVTEEDEGLYVCEADNLVDRISHSATLIVHSQPTFLVEPKDVKVNVNGVAKFDCMASGNPRPSVFWTKEGNQFLMFPDNKYDRFSVTPEGSLIISPVKKEDKGYYVCSALSVVGSATTKAYLNISSLAADLPPPIIVLGPADQTLPEHSTAILPCDATGTPQPSLKWFLNNNPIPFNNPRFKVLDTGTLQIDDLLVSDSGEYKCLAYSENGEASWSAQLKVAPPHSPNTMFHRMPDPSTFPDPPSRPNIVNVTENSVTISWIRTGRDGASPVKGVIIEYFSPDHHNEWIKAAKGITGDRYTVMGLKSGSRYYFLVRAQNNHGIGPPSPISYEARTLGNVASNHLAARMLDLNDVRKKLENIVVELKDVRTISSSAVKLFWTVHGGQEYIEGFYIRYRIIDPKTLSLSSNPDMNDNNNNNNGESKYSNMVTVYNGGATTYIINNLPKYTTFEFFLVPFYKSIDGRPSNSRVVRTLEGVPSAPPSSIKARPISSSSALITWQPPPPEQVNGYLLGYIIFVHGAYTPYNINLTVNANTTSYMLRNLTTETEYIIQITAFTSVGVGVPSSPLTFIMDPILSNDVYNDEHNDAVSSMFDSSNVWICVLIISLVILSLIVLLLGFLLFKKRSSLLKKNNENLTLNRELKTQNDPFYNRHFEFSKGWQTDSRPQCGDLKHPPPSTNMMLKISPTMATTDNNGYSTVTTDDQAADYADYDYVSQHGENNYESTTYESYAAGRDAPIAYASSNIIASNPYRITNNTQPQQQQPHPHPSMQWRTQFNIKNDNHMKPNFTATLDRTAIMNGGAGQLMTMMDNNSGGRYKKSMYDVNLVKNLNAAAEPLIGGHLNDYGEDSVGGGGGGNHYHYADSNAYCGNVTQIPSSKLMANQVKYGSLSRINNNNNNQQQSQFYDGSNKIGGGENDNFSPKNSNLKKKPTGNGTSEWKPFYSGENRDIGTLPSSSPILKNHQLDFEPKTFTNKNRHLITNPLALQQQQPLTTNTQYERQMNLMNTTNTNINTKNSGLANMYKSSRTNDIINNIIDICDSESTYQELS